MTSPAQHGINGNAKLDAEDTLRLVAGLPAPEGLADRVHARLRTAPRRSALLHWPMAPVMGYRLHSPAFRAMAAGVIVCVVAGGGWQIYSHVPGAPAANAIVQPARVGGSGGFSNAGAMRTPDTLDRPVLKQPVTRPHDSSAAESQKTSPAGKTRKPAKHTSKVDPAQQ